MNKNGFLKMEPLMKKITFLLQEWQVKNNKTRYDAKSTMTY